jgi:ABC-2 type transport system permease protein
VFARIRNLTIKEILQLTRDWVMLGFILVAPVVELVLLAHSTGRGVKGLYGVVVDQDHSQLSRQMVAAIDNTDEVDIVAYLDTAAEAAVWLRRNEALLAIVIPAGFEADLQAARLPQVQLISDGANSVTAASALNAASGAINVFAAQHAAVAGLQDVAFFALRAQVRYNPTLDFRFFSVTAQLGFIVYQVTMMVSSLGLARERELGTLEQLLVTPLQRLELIIGKSIPALVVAGIDFVLMWAVAVWGFNLPMRGSFLLMLGLSLLFIAAQIGWGLTVSSMSHTQQQAVLLVFVLAMVDISFSGYMVPIERMPAGLRLLSQFFPLQHYLVIIRMVMLKGAGLSAVAGEAFALAALGIASGAVAMVSLRRQLD